MVQEEVLELVGKYLRKIHRVGNDNISAICPFHAKSDGSEERHPSFSMSLSRGVWQCFTCHRSGVFADFLRDVGIPRVALTTHYGELLDALRRQAGPKYDPLRPKVVVATGLEESMLGLFDMCPAAMVDPELSALLDPDDPIVFEEELLQSYDIGFDAQHMRITFPLRDMVGTLVGISGRTVNGEYPRYKVYDKEYVDFGYPAVAQTRKGSLLWNAHRVYPGLFRGSPDQFVLVVEGFRGCLWAIQSGVTNTVSLLGSNLSRDQRWILERMGCRVYLMLDNDEPGLRALKGWTDEDGRRWPGIAEELSKSLDVSIVTYAGKQPTRLTQEALCYAVNTAESYHRWVLNNRSK